MKQIVITRNGGPNVLKLQEKPDPVPKDEEVTIRVKPFQYGCVTSTMQRRHAP